MVHLLAICESPTCAHTILCLALPAELRPPRPTLQRRDSGGVCGGRSMARAPNRLPQLTTAAPLHLARDKGESLQLTVRRQQRACDLAPGCHPVHCPSLPPPTDACRALHRPAPHRHAAVRPPRPRLSANWVAGDGGEAAASAAAAVAAAAHPPPPPLPSYACGHATVCTRHAALPHLGRRQPIVIPCSPERVGFTWLKESYADRHAVPCAAHERRRR